MISRIIGLFLLTIVPAFVYAQKAAGSWTLVLNSSTTNIKV